MRRGFTLPELLVSLTVMSVVFSLATHFALRQIRFFRDAGDADAARSQLAQVTEIVRGVLADVSPPTGELLVAQDSTLEVRLTIGTSFVCRDAVDRVVFPLIAPPASGGASAFVRSPAPGDRLSALFSDTAGATWLHLEVASSPTPETPCGAVTGVDTTRSVTTVEPMALPAGTALRFTRPLRLSIYRSSDGRWYLGARDWNAESRRFNAIQPVAGPLLPYDDDAPGLRFLYKDGQGESLEQPVDVGRIASVIVAARTSTDSMVAVVRLRNAR